VQFKCVCVWVWVCVCVCVHACVESFNYPLPSAPSLRVSMKKCVRCVIRNIPFSSSSSASSVSPVLSINLHRLCMADWRGHNGDSFNCNRHKEVCVCVCLCVCVISPDSSCCGYFCRCCWTTLRANTSSDKRACVCVCVCVCKCSYSFVQEMAKGNKDWLPEQLRAAARDRRMAFYSERFGAQKEEAEFALKFMQTLPGIYSH
jgi:hypothetical protein